MEVAIDLTKDLAAAYWNASPAERRLLNQAFFERLEIMEDDVAGSTTAEPFRTLLDPDFIAALATGALASEPDRDGQNDRTPAYSQDGGSITGKMVGDTGLEPVTSALSRRRSPS
jgi:hypothetical protein